MKKIDILQHILVPPCSILSEEEAKELLAKYNIAPSQLPSISYSDPMVKSLKAKPGQIIKIERQGPTGKYFYYRRVVK